MPRDTFFNLSEEKREKILLAAKAEFSEHELFKSRVSNIIKNAEIPRGSFYQYFEDLEDLYYYVIDEFFDRFFHAGNEFTKDTDDLFEFSIKSFSFDYDAYTNDKRHSFMMNVLKSISNNNEYIEHYNAKKRNYILEVLSKLDLSNIRFNDDNDLIKMYQMIQDVKRNVIRKSLIDKLTKEQAMEEVRWYIDILKQGLVIKEN
jgi:AcrR family transcriptional regulator